MLNEYSQHFLIIYLKGWEYESMYKNGYIWLKLKEIKVFIGNQLIN